MKKKVFSILFALVLALSLSLVTAVPVAAATQNAEYYSHVGTISPSGGTITECIAAPDDGKFVQLGPGSWITLKFPGNYAAVPDGTSAADLRIDTYDVPYPADAEIFLSLNGATWTSAGIYSDTANIDLDLPEISGPVKYVKVDQGTHYIDPAYPTLGFDLDAVVALNAGIIPYGSITSPAEGQMFFGGTVNFDAIYWDDDPLGIQWAVRRDSTSANTLWGNVDGHSDPYTWDGHLFHSSADVTSWPSGVYFAFVWNPVEGAGEPNMRLIRTFYIDKPPTVGVDNADVKVDEGAIADNTGTWSDPDGDSVTLSASVGSILKNNGTWSWSFQTSDGPTQSQTVTITATDEHGATGTATFSLTVSNVEPSVTINSPADFSVYAVGDTVTLMVSFTDPGTDDTHSADIDWESGTDPHIDSVVSPFYESIVYSTAGVYTIEVAVTDDDGGTGRAYVTVVVYDPSAGFVTGGGWIYSAAGADKLHPAADGKANFGFVSKYKKGADTPDGQTEFQFKAGDLNFHSTSYDWLVVTGSNYAKFKGIGTINGEGEYKFQIWAGDGEPDTFRVKIWTETGGPELPVYDNGMDQPIEGGQIVVHTSKK